MITYPNERNHMTKTLMLELLEGVLLIGFASCVGFIVFTLLPETEEGR